MKSMNKIKANPAIPIIILTYFEIPLLLYSIGLSLLSKNLLLPNYYPCLYFIYY